jgi:hypothetical protein
MKLSIKDVQRAVASAGRVDTFAGLYLQGLTSSPLDIAPRLDLELPLPSPAALCIEDSGMSAILLGRQQASETVTVPSDIQIILTAAPAAGKNLPAYVKDMIAKVQPDLLA